MNSESQGNEKQGKIERFFESFLWNCRYIVILAVISSMISSGILFVLATLDVGKLVVKAVNYYSHSSTLLIETMKEPSAAEGGVVVDAPHPASEASGYDEFHSAVVSHVISAVDDFLLATVLLIFSLGLYELFISKINQAEGDTDYSSQILLIKTLDDLKDRLAKVVLMILIVTFFKNVIHTTFTDPLNILYLGAGILMVALALYFTYKSGHAKA